MWWPPVTANELSCEEQSPEQLVVAALRGNSYPIVILDIICQAGL